MRHVDVGYATSFHKRVKKYFINTGTTGVYKKSKERKKENVGERRKERKCERKKERKCYGIAEGFRFMPLSLVRLRTFRLSTWVS